MSLGIGVLSSEPSVWSEYHNERASFIYAQVKSLCEFMHHQQYHVTLLFQPRNSRFGAINGCNFSSCELCLLHL